MHTTLKDELLSIKHQHCKWAEYIMRSRNKRWTKKITWCTQRDKKLLRGRQCIAWKVEIIKKLGENVSHVTN